jgi:hypothetical protein
MTKIAKSFRFEEVDIQSWQVAANRSRLSLSEWIRRSCNVVEAMEIAPSDRTSRPGSVIHAPARMEVDETVDVVVAEIEVAKPKLGGEKLDTTLCQHNLFKSACPRCKRG